MENTSVDGTSWFLVRQGRRHGPFDRRRLVQELLGLDCPEDTLVWHAGLPAWVKSSEIADIARELPPPVPGAAVAANSPGAAPAWTDAVPDATAGPGEDATDPSAAPKESTGQEEDDGQDDGQGDGKGQSNRRRHRQRRRGPVEWLPYALPVLLLFMAAMLGLWLLLRRLNEVPPGRIIQEGALFFPTLPTETRIAKPREAVQREAPATAARSARPA
jgi:uncharacterized protein DUF4339